MERYMGKRWIALLLAVCLLWAMALPACLAEDENDPGMARDIAKECKFKSDAGRDKLKYLTDGNYRNYWPSKGGTSGYLDVTLPQGETCSGVSIKWYERAMAWCVKVKSEAGEWTAVASDDQLFYSSYLELPEGITSFRITPMPGEKGRMNIAQIHILSAGQTPDWVQRFNPPAEKADLMVLVAHPDDELLWMGGAIPYYAGEAGKVVQVAYIVPTMPYRRLELLDGLWHCGDHTYPDIGTRRDVFASSLTQIYKKWSKAKLYASVVSLFRRYQPDVVVTHDVHGEYGHGAHQAVCDAVKYATSHSGKSSCDAASKKRYGLWTPKKVYIHLYPDHQITMDWRQPLDYFKGETAFDIAAEAFDMHVSQRHTDYVVEDSGRYDNRLFGLYFTSVGPDTGADFFENIIEEM